MKLVKTLLLPYLKRFWLMLLSVVLVGAFGCGILIGLRNAFHSLNKNINSLLSECGYPDLYVETISDIDNSYVGMLPGDYKQELGIEQIEYRATYTTTFIKNESAYSTRLIGYSQDTFLKHHLVEGELTDDSIQMEYYFAKSNGMHIGDKISAKMPNGNMVDLTINAFVVSPETAVVKADPYSISSSRDFAYIYIPRSIIIANSSKAYFNQMLINFEEGKEKTIEQSVDAFGEYIHKKTGAEITDEMVEKLRKNIAYATTYKDSEVITFYNEALTAINLITLLAPAVFFLVVLIVTALFLFQIVKQCRKDIGVMRALGEQTSSISIVFLALGFVVGFISWLVGMGIGSIFTLLANEAYGSAMKLFPQSFYFYPWIILISLGTIVFVTMFTSFLASLNIARIKPVEAMKALPPSKNNTPLLTRTVFKKAPITVKVTISQTLRNIGRYLFSGLCLLASGMLIFVALAIGESKNAIMAQLFDARINYDVQVYFDNMPSDDDINLMFPNDDTNIKEKSLIKYLPSEIKKDDRKATVLINGIKPDQHLINVVSDYQDIIEVPQDGIILSQYHASLLDAKVGDTIVANNVPLEVKAISRQFIYQVSYTSFDGYDTDYSRGSLLLKVNDEQAFFEKYKDNEHVTYVSYTKVIRGEYNDRLLAFELSSKLLTFMAVVTGFMIVFNMMQTNLKEQKRTFATMRTLGYQRSEISLANLFTSLIQYVISMVLAIPLGVVMAQGLLYSISVPSQIQPFPKSWVMYVLSVVFVLAFLLLSHFIVMSSMRKWNLPESVKERE